MSEKELLVTCSAEPECRFGIWPSIELIKLINLINLFPATRLEVGGGGAYLVRT
jgi:hypothetical protein